MPSIIGETQVSKPMQLRLLFRILCRVAEVLLDVTEHEIDDSRLLTEGLGVVQGYLIFHVMYKLGPQSGSRAQ